MAAANNALVREIVGDLLGYQATAAEQDAGATAQRLTAQGYDTEVQAYSSGEAIARQNAMLEGISGEIQSVQEMRDLARSVGATRAAIAGAGFKESGTAIDQIQADLRQGYLNDQLIRTQSSLSAGGYLEQAAADALQAQGARMAQQSAQETAAAYDTAAATTRTNLANETAALTTYLKQFGSSNPELDLVTGALGRSSAASLTPTQQQTIGGGGGYFRTSPGAAALSRGSPGGFGNIVIGNRI